VDLISRLQIKPGMLVAVVAAPPDGPNLAGAGADPAAGADPGASASPGAGRRAGAAAGPLQLTDHPDEANAVIAFARSSGDLAGTARPAIDAARQDKLAWIAYPKAGQLGTDLNRDRLVAAVADQGVQPVRQIAIDEIWSALRFRPA
jgi:hypothetical protein